MKTNGLSRRPSQGLATLGAFIAGAFLLSASPEDPPVITSIHLEGTNVVVTARRSAYSSVMRRFTAMFICAVKYW